MSLFKVTLWSVWEVELHSLPWNFHQRSKICSEREVSLRNRAWPFEAACLPCIRNVPSSEVRESPHHPSTELGELFIPQSLQHTDEICFSSFKFEPKLLEKSVLTLNLFGRWHTPFTPETPARVMVVRTFWETRFIRLPLYFLMAKGLPNIFLLLKIERVFFFFHTMYSDYSRPSTLLISSLPLLRSRSTPFLSLVRKHTDIFKKGIETRVLHICFSLIWNRDITTTRIPMAIWINIWSILIILIMCLQHENCFTEFHIHYIVHQRMRLLVAICHMRNLGY